jgi:predicted 3-demethylubiquinone-9 3-methyltransferase (glyoxalase superfamily)
MTTTVTPFLVFEGQAEEAITFYVSLIPNSRIVDIKRYDAEAQGKEGSIMTAFFEIGGLTVMCTDSPVSHNFTFTPSSSLFVTCASEGELDRLAAALGEGGQVMMPIGNYGFSTRFTWVSDRYGVSWQLNLP